MWYFLITLIFIGGGLIILRKFSGRDRKFFLILWLSLPIVLVGLIILFLGKGANSFVPFKADRTEREMKQIEIELERYKDFHKNYPENLKAIIGNDPLKRDLRSDFWQNLYIYQVGTNKQSYVLTSPGSDGLVNTHDDIIQKGGD